MNLDFQFSWILFFNFLKKDSWWLLEMSTVPRRLSYFEEIHFIFSNLKSNSSFAIMCFVWSWMLFFFTRNFRALTRDGTWSISSFALRMLSIWRLGRYLIRYFKNKGALFVSSTLHETKSMLLRLTVFIFLRALRCCFITFIVIFVFFNFNFQLTILTTSRNGNSTLIGVG